MKHFYLLLITLFIGSFGFAQGLEDFTNSNATSSYSTSSFTGNNSITWSYVASRDENGDDNSSGIDGNALMLRRSSNSSKVTSSTISGGIGDFSVKLYKGFTGGGDREVELFINGISQGTSTPFDDNDEHIFSVSGIDISGDIIIEIKNTTSKQVIVDDITWTAAGPTNTEVQFASSDASVSESAGTYDLVIEIVNEDVEATTFDVILTSGDAADIASYTAQSETFPGSSTTHVTVTITVTDDAIIENDEVFTFEIQNVAGGNNATIGTNNTFDLTITNNDFPTTVEFTSSSASVPESAGTYDLVIEITNEDVAATTFDVVLTSGDATDIASYTTQSETFPGSSTTDVTVAITVTDDAIIEADDVFTFEIQNVAGGNSAATGTNNTFDLTITNNDFPTTVEFISSSASVSESIGTYDLEFTIANESATATSFDVVLIGGTGDTSDIATYTTQTITFPSGTSANQTATLTITDDMLFEGDETLIFEIQNVAGGNTAVIGTESSFTLTMTDNDTPPPCNSIFADDFSGDLSDWSNTGDWTINSGELKHDLSGTSGSSYIYTDLGVQDYSSTDYEWEFCVSNGNWDPSSGNKFAFTLFSDDSNLLSTPTGYAVGVNQSDSSDDLKLYSVNNGVYTSIIASTFDWNSNDDVCIRVTRSASGAWELFYNDDGAGEVSVGTTTNTSYTSGDYLGAGFVFSSSRAGLLYIDDINVCKVEAVSLNDTDTEVTSATVVAGATITAANSTTSGTAFNVLGFEVEDLGTADALSTNITTMRFIPGPNNTAAWTDHIQGVTLVDENAVPYAPTTTITDSEIILTFASPITITDGTSLEFLLGIYLHETAIIDGSIIQLQINDTSSGFDADLAGSDFADPFLFGDIVGNNMIIDVDATALSFTTEPSEVFINDTMSPSVDVSYVDANGNIDTDYTGSGFDISLTTDGSFDATAVIVAEATNGVATFNNLIFDAVGTGLKLTATDDTTFIAGTFDSATFNVNAIPVNGWQITAEDTTFVIDFDTTVTEVNNGAFDASGFTPSPSSGQLDSDAWGSTGMSDGTMDFGDIETSGDYAKGISTGGVSSGGFYAFDTGSGNSTLGFQPTGSDFIPGTLTLRAQNQTGTTVTVADLAYLIYVNNNEARSSSFNFSYSTDDSSYTDVAALDYASTLSSDGLGWVSNSKSTSITGLSIADGGYLYLRWSTDDNGGGGSRDEFALDDISLKFNPVAPTTYTFNGAWSPSDPNGTATASDDIVIASGNATIDTNTTANSVTVNAGAGLTVDTGITLTTANGLALKSVSDSYSSLILDGTVSGTLTYERHVNINGVGSTGSNDLVSAPLTGQAFDDFVIANPNILNNGTLYLFGPFDKPTGEYITYDGTVAATLDAGIGYRAASTNNGTFTFTGVANSGNVPVTIENNGIAFEEWNLVGNPYPSYITLADFLTVNNTLFSDSRSGVYGYDGDASNGWTIWNQSYSDANSGKLIAPGQGFFVSSKTASGTLNFNSNMRTTGASDDFIQGRSSNETTISYLSLQITNSTKAFNTDFYFNDTATLGLNPGYDSGVFGSTGDFSLYSHLVEENTGLAMGIQTLNNANLSTEVIIPLGVNANQGEQLTFSIAESTLASSVNVYLEDNVANTSTLLTTGDYILTPSVGLTETGRFYLRFTESTLSTIDNNLDALSIYSDKAERTIVIAGQLLEPTSASVYDVQGRLVKTTQLQTTNRLQSIDVSELSHGIYVVKLHNKAQNKTQKVILR